MPGKYDKYTMVQVREKPWKIHPVWRGIGCLMMIIIPIMSYAGGVLLVQANNEARWVPVAPELIQAVEVPFIGVVPALVANLLAAAILALIGFALLTLLFAVFTRLAAPPTNNYDAPPVRRSPRARRR